MAYTILVATASFLAGCDQTPGVDIDAILNTQDDVELCDALSTRMVEHYGVDFDISKCKEKDQPVILAWHARGIIDNGGMQYLFEHDFKGDPHYARIAAAFKTIKASKCAEAIEEALARFPNSQPPLEIEARLKLYQGAPEDERRATDS